MVRRRSSDRPQPGDVRVYVVCTDRGRHRRYVFGWLTMIPEHVRAELGNTAWTTDLPNVEDTAARSSLDDPAFDPSVGEVRAWLTRKYDCPRCPRAPSIPDDKLQVLAAKLSDAGVSLPIDISNPDYAL